MTNFNKNRPYAYGALRACGAVRPLAYEFFANFSNEYEMNIRQ